MLQLITIVFLCYAGAAVLLILAFSARPASELSVADRVRRTARGAVLRDEQEMRKSFFQRVLMPLSERVGNRLLRVTPGTLTENASRLLEQAGLGSYLSGAQVAGFSWLLGIGFPLGFFILYGALDINGWLKLALYIVAALVGFRLPSILIGARAKARKEAIVKAMPFALDLLSISVEAGMGFDGALQTVCDQSRGPLPEEFARTLTEVRLGKPRNKALIDLGNRTGVEDLKRFTSAVAFVSDLGGSLVQVLNVQAEAMRVVRRQRAEEKAMKAPIKMMFPLVLFIFPTIGIVILFPAAYNIYSNFIR